MKSLADIPAHVGPPDRPGWWVLLFPTREPFLHQFGEENLADAADAWQDGYQCWPLDLVVETSRIEDLLTKVAGKPTLLWELSQCFARLLVAGPWTPIPIENFGHHTQVPDGRHDPGEPVWERFTPNGGVAAWAGKIAGDTAYYAMLPGQVPRLHGTLVGAKEEADRFLRVRGFHLIELA